LPCLALPCPCALDPNRYFFGFSLVPLNSLFLLVQSASPSFFLLFTICLLASTKKECAFQPTPSPRSPTTSTVFGAPRRVVCTAAVCSLAQRVSVTFVAGLSSFLTGKIPRFSYIYCAPAFFAGVSSSTVGRPHALSSFARSSCASFSWETVGALN
jgi:hypothetical protein